MNQIRGAHEARLAVTRGERDPEYREAVIRDYVLAHKGEVIKLSTFSKIAYGKEGAGSAHYLVKRLIKQRRLTRHKVNRGRDGKKETGYTYEWHNPRIPVPSSQKNGPVINIPLLESEEEAVSSSIRTSGGCRYNVQFQLTVVKEDGAMFDGGSVQVSKLPLEKVQEAIQLVLSSAKEAVEASKS